MSVPFVVEDKKYHNKFGVFIDRFDAGDKLANLLLSNLNLNVDKTDLIAIPAGGVPVALPIVRKFNLRFKILLVSKILFPWTTEAGFGALSMFDDLELNEEAIRRYGLDRRTIEEQIKKTKEKIAKRLKIVPKKCLIGEKGEIAILVDDGLASGYTMLVAIKSAKRFYNKTYVAVPTASSHAVELISKKCDGIFCVNLRNIYPYAVADAYLEWHDVSDNEMLKLLDVLSRYCEKE